MMRVFLLLSFSIGLGILLVEQAVAHSPSIVPPKEVPDHITQEYCRAMRAKAVKNNPDNPPAEDEMFPLSRVPPSWPRGERRSGYVKFEFVVGTDGRPKDIKVIESSGPRYTREGIRMLKKWRYCPAFRDGVPVETETDLTLNFSRKKSF